MSFSSTEQGLSYPPPKKEEEFFCPKTENIGTYRDGDGTIDTKELSTVLRHIDSYTTYIVDSNFEETKVFYVNFFYRGT